MESDTGQALDRFRDAAAFIAHVMATLGCQPSRRAPFAANPAADPGSSAVLFPLGNHCLGDGFEPCLLLNKRSEKVRQPGDLCCPGGSISPKVDRLLAKVLVFPGFPLARWPHWPVWRDRHPLQAHRLAVLLATSLRESLEEMRLNPMGVRFIGPLPEQRLVMFRRSIFPMAGWIGRQQRFFPNWEVEKIVRIPIRTLLDPANFRRYRLHVKAPSAGGSDPQAADYPFFVHQQADPPELLWGATYRIVIRFMEQVFDFTPPPMDTLSVVDGVLDENYLRGGRTRTVRA